MLGSARLCGRRLLVTVLRHCGRGWLAPAAAGGRRRPRAGDAARRSRSTRRQARAARRHGAAVAPATPSAPGSRLPARTVAVAGGVGDRRARRRAALPRGPPQRRPRPRCGSPPAATSSTLSGKLGRSRVTLFSARGRPALDATRQRRADRRARRAHARGRHAAQAARCGCGARRRRARARHAHADRRLGQPPPRPRRRRPSPTAPRPRPRRPPTPAPAPRRRRAPTASPPRRPAARTGSPATCPARRPQELDELHPAAPSRRRAGSGAGSVTASGGAQRVDPAAAYDHRFPVARPSGASTARSTIRLAGTVTYTMPAHGIDESIGACGSRSPRTAATGQVFADGRSQRRQRDDVPGPAARRTPTSTCSTST